MGALRKPAALRLCLPAEQTLTHPSIIALAQVATVAPDAEDKAEGYQLICPLECVDLRRLDPPRVPPAVWDDAQAERWRRPGDVELQSFPIDAIKKTSKNADWRTEWGARTLAEYALRGNGVPDGRIVVHWGKGK